MPGQADGIKMAELRGRIGSDGVEPDEIRAPGGPWRYQPRPIAGLAQLQLLLEIGKWGGYDFLAQSSAWPAETLLCR